MKDDYIKSVPLKLSQFSKYLGDYKWLAGENVTTKLFQTSHFNVTKFNKFFQISFVDFILYEMLDQHLILIPDCLDSFPNLKSYCERFRSLESIKTYMSSSDFITRPLNNPHAGFK